MARHEIEVWLPVQGPYVFAGRLFVTHVRNSFNTTFEYASEYIADPASYTFDPAFKLRLGAQVHPKGGFAGALSDSQPDRWGKRLIARDRSNRGLPVPTELDFLLAISDESRMGALRYKAPGAAEFLAPSESRKIPPLTELPRLSRLAESAESDEAFDELAELAEAGGSLGGARPKVNVVDSDGSLSIAKFTSVKDDYSTIAWEYASLRIAQRAGIHTPKSKLLRVGGRSVLIMARFDRTRDESGEHHRVPYMSAMSLLQLADGEHSSYVEIAEELESDQDKQELFRRAALGLLIRNTDDHLRNHGLLLGPAGWRLSPAFDINPGTDKTEHETMISPFSNDSVDSLVEAAPLFAMNENEALDALREVVEAVDQWRNEARMAGISQSEVNSFEAVFLNEHSIRAHELLPISDAPKDETH